jgi:hypothetical protein
MSQVVVCGDGKITWLGFLNGLNALDPPIIYEKFR